MSILNAITAGAGGVALSGDTSGNLTIQSAGTNVATFTTGGNMIMATGGIQFAANPGGGTSGTLNDYEVGSWTPRIDSNGLNGTGRVTTVNNAKYTKIGNICYFTCYINMGTLGSGGSGNTSIFGLPFTSATNSGNALQAVSVAYFDTLNSTVVCLGAFVADNTTQINLEYLASAGVSMGGMTFATYVKAGTTFIIAGCYQTAS